MSSRTEPLEQYIGEETEPFLVNLESVSLCFSISLTYVDHFQDLLAFSDCISLSLPFISHDLSYVLKSIDCLLITIIPFSFCNCISI